MRVVLLLSMLSFLSFRMPTQPTTTWLNSSIGWLSEKVDLSFSRPDLSCSDKGQLDVNGSVITITNYKIKNIGFSDASVSYVGYYLSTDKNFTTSDIFLGHDYVGGLAQRESSTENFMIDLSGMDIPEGEYYVGTVIDYMDSVVEVNEDNNNDYFWDAPKVVIGGKPNLACKGNGELTIDGLNIKIGWVSVINNGDASAGASKIGFYLSTNQTFSTSDIFLGSRDVEPLDAGEFVMIPSFEIDLETLDLDPDTYYVGFIIDYKDDVMESNENDNNDCSYEEVIVIEEIPSGDPNLACKDRGTLEIDDDRATINGLKIRNYGDATSKAGQVGIYLSDDTNFTTDDLLIKTRSLKALEPGEEQMYLAIDIDLSVYDLDPDTYFIGIIVDDTNETAESNENDNATCFWDEPTYKVEEGDPNLACKERGELIIDNETGDIYIGWTTVGNYGDAPAGESIIGFYASTDNSFDDDDVLIATREIGALEPDESEMIEEINTNTAELGLNPGLYFVIAVIDHENDVAESNEEDNDDCFWDEPKIYIPNSDVDLACKTLGELIIDNNDKSYYIGWTTIINNGSTTAPSSEIGFYVSTDTEFSDDDVLFATQETGAIEAGETYMIDEIEDVLDVDLPAGTYNVLVVIDHKEEVAETNEKNNDDCFWQEPRFFIPAAEPDLACKTLGELIIDNDDLSYYIGWTTVVNNGDAKAGKSRIGFYVSTDASLSDDDELFASQEIGMLEPGESQMIEEIEDVLDLDLAPGTYQVLVKIDDLNQVDESNEANNDDCFWDEPRFFIPEENRAPNLTCKDRGFLTVNGANISISNLKITNDGNDFAGVSKAGIYLSENQFFSSSDILVGTVNIPKLSPGQIFNLNFNKDLSSLDLDTGEFFVGIIVDKDNQVDESDETDNNGCNWTSPKVEMIPAKPNLVCAGAGSLVITNKTDLKFSFLKVKNDGNAEAGASRIGFYLSTDANITTGDIFLGSKSIGSLDPGETITPSAFNKSISSLNLADGTYHAGFILDYDKKVMESNENDNNDCRYDNKVVIDNSKANLKCESRGEVVVDGTKVKISWYRVKNAGDKKSPASKIGFYLSTDTHFTTDDYFIGSRSIDALDPGATDLISALEVDVAGLNIPYGTYYIGAYIDYTYIVEEYSETDNNDCYYSNKVTIPQPKPNLVCHDRGELQIDGKEVHISWSKVKNAGDGYSESTKVGFYLSKDTHFSTSDKLLGTTTLPKLSPGEVKLLSAFNKDISDMNLDPGKYYVGIIIDPYNSISETSDADNNDCYWTNPYVTIQPPKPNLTCMSRGEIGANGSTITISWSKIKNDGGSTAAPSYVGYYLSKDTHFSTS
ncbi:MAG: CARDB domain-containing protein, partial [Bacteroidota bacterium]